MSAAPARKGRDARRARSALRAHIRQEFTAPAAAIVGFADMLIEDVARLGLADLRPDLDRIREAGAALGSLLDGVLAADPEAADPETVPAKLRHDLRTPINAIKGYSEMLIEDAEAGGYAALAPDLARLLGAAEDMLKRIDALVAFSAQAPDADAADAPPATFAGVTRAMEAIRPVSPALARGPAGRILVVDDNASNRDLLARRLARDGHAVDQAEGGMAALARLHDAPFDLVLLDLMMPDISGYEVLTRMKADPATRDIPVIMISALDDLDSIVRCIEAGAVDYLSKPFDPTLLRARIGASLENKRLRDRENAMVAELRAEKARSEALLLNILPQAVVERIKAGEQMIADDVVEATILFADLADFTPMAGRLTAADLVGMLNRVFSAFDRLADRFGAEKIKTIGDAYMVAFGIPEPRADHAEAGARLALSMLDAMRDIGWPGESLALRVGLHSGPAIAGVIGERKFAYDVWGNTVNIASRLESHGLPGRIHVSEPTFRTLSGRFAFEPRGKIAIKGAGAMSTYFLEREIGRPPPLAGEG